MRRAEWKEKKNGTEEYYKSIKKSDRLSPSNETHSSHFSSHVQHVGTLDDLKDIRRTRWSREFEQ